MTILLHDPTGQVARTPRQTEGQLSDLIGKKVGFIFNQHMSAAVFWKAFEQEVEQKLSPSAVHRVYKQNTWSPAPKADVERLMRETDYILVGVGA